MGRLALLATLALSVGLVMLGQAAPSKARAGAGLPVCGYLDLPTRFSDPADWQRTLVDTLFRVPKDYVPPDLVAVSDAGVEGTGQVRELVIADLTGLAAAAREAGTPVAVQSGYRSYAYQVKTFNSWAAAHGYDNALEASARPGHSEHQLGLAIDVMSVGGGAPWDVGDWATTPEGRWMQANAWRYGFVMSYPKAKADVTCYAYEPWHYRYVGRDAAASIHDSGATLREYLWDQGNDVLADLVPGASGTQSPMTTVRPTSEPSRFSTATPASTPGATSSAESGVAAAAGGPGDSADDAISPAGVALSVAIGLVILVTVEQLNREIRRRGRRVAVRPSRRGRWDQARRSSSIPSS